MAGRPKNSEQRNANGGLVKGAPLEPIGFVERELTTPDGRTIRVEVPVYPPFRLEADPEKRAPAKAPTRRKKTPTRKTG